MKKSKKDPMRYMYLVISIVKNDPPGVTSWPVLGVHSNKESATDHYLAVKLDRMKRGAFSCWDVVNTSFFKDSPHRTIRESYLQHKREGKEIQREFLHIERYPICKK
jgi:hypothetical protein